jgi:hypothetical protein
MCTCWLTLCNDDEHGHWCGSRVEGCVRGSAYSHDDAGVVEADVGGLGRVACDSDGCLWGCWEEVSGKGVSPLVCVRLRGRVLVEAKSTPTPAVSRIQVAISMFDVPSSLCSSSR